MKLAIAIVLFTFTIVHAQPRLTPDKDGTFTSLEVVPTNSRTSRNPAGTIIWYNGNPNGINGLYSVYGEGYTYDDFYVPSGVNTITAVYANYLTDYPFTNCEWIIRSDVSAGYAGTVVASNYTSCSQTPTGRVLFDIPEVTILIEDINVPVNPGGQYWLTIAADTGGVEYRSGYIPTTSGANAIGNPPGNDGNAYFDSTYFGSYFGSSLYQGSDEVDFVMGVYGVDCSDRPYTESLLLWQPVAGNSHSPVGTADLSFDGTDLQAILTMTNPAYKIVRTQFYAKDARIDSGGPLPVGTTSNQNSVVVTASLTPIECDSVKYISIKVTYKTAPNSGTSVAWVGPADVDSPGASDYDLFAHGNGLGLSRAMCCPAP